MTSDHNPDDHCGSMPCHRPSYRKIRPCQPEIRNEMQQMMRIHIVFINIFLEVDNPFQLNSDRYYSMNHIRT